jgi:hypothetical protein
MTKNDYLPTKCWFENDGTLMRGYFVYDENADSPRDWDNLGIIVNASRYNLCGHHDIETNSIEEWLINETGINEEWYYNNKERYGGIDALLEKFQNEKCAAFTFISVYDHSGICVYAGYCTGWDYSAVGFAYIPKNSKEVKSYRKGHSAEETKDWANRVLEGEIHDLDNWCRGNVYGCVTEEYNEELEEWDVFSGDSCYGYYLNDTSSESEEKDAINIIKDFAGDHKLFDYEEVESAIENKSLDVLKGQLLFDFGEAV